MQLKSKNNSLKITAGVMSLIVLGIVIGGFLLPKQTKKIPKSARGINFSNRAEIVNINNGQKNYPRFIKNLALDPAREVKIGEKQLYSVWVEDPLGIDRVKAEIKTDNSKRILDLKLVAGNHKKGKWTAFWWTEDISQDSSYKTVIYAVNSRNRKTSIAFTWQTADIFTKSGFLRPLRSFLFSFVKEAEAATWVSPTSGTGSSWTNVPNAYDGDIQTAAAGPWISWGYFSDYLYLDFGRPVNTNKLRFHTDDTHDDGIDVIYIDIYKNGTWVNIFSGTVSLGWWEYYESSFSQGLVTKARVRYHSRCQPSGYVCNNYFYEFQLYDLGTPAPQISVTPSSQSFGDVDIGSTKNLTFTVQNSGQGTLSGSVSGLAAPFSCVSGCSYNLPAGASQITTIRFSPTSEGSFSDTAIFSGGDGADRNVSGNGIAVSIANCGLPHFNSDMHINSSTMGGSDTCEINGEVGIEDGNLYIDSGMTIQMNPNSTIIFNQGKFIRVDGIIAKSASNTVIKKGHISISKPDLIITDIWFDANRKVNYTVKNQGNQDISSSFTQGLRVLYGSSWIIMAGDGYEDSLTNLSVGSSKNGIINNWQCAAGETYAKIVIQADDPWSSSGDVVDESDEDNNILIKYDLVCPGGGTITCSSDSDCNDGDSCTNDVCNNAGTTSSYCSHPANYSCGDGTCDSSCGETSSNCPADCGTITCSSDSDCNDGDYCTDDICYNAGTTSSYCSNPAADRCGDGTCNCGENSSSCPADCAPPNPADDIQDCANYAVYNNTPIGGGLIAHTGDLLAQNNDGYSYRNYWCKVGSNCHVDEGNGVETWTSSGGSAMCRTHTSINCTGIGSECYVNTYYNAECVYCIVK